MRSSWGLFLTTLALLNSLCSCVSQTTDNVVLVDRSAELAAIGLFCEQLTENYGQYLDTTLWHQRFTLADIAPVIQALPAPFKVSEAGRSVEQRPIYRVQWGMGKTQVLLWSQMHGDEPTATAALLDIFRWLAAQGDGHDRIRQLLAEQMTLTFLPMLNPDGAERFTRRNAIGIDLNRDALRLASPESRILKGERDRLSADWGFNLHDQSRYYGVGFPAEKVAALSILAPAYDWEKSVNTQRQEAIQLIALMNNAWQKAVPGGVGRYNDDFEPRAFGDNLQKWGTRTILIESGGSPTDWEKQDLRKLNFVGILAALHGIANQAYQGIDPQNYWDIPENSYNAFYDLILRNVSLEVEGEARTVDVAIRQDQWIVPGDTYQYYLDASILDLGDLHTFKGFEELDGSGLVVRSGKTYPRELSHAELQKINYSELHQLGYTAIPVIDLKEAWKVTNASGLAQSAGARLLPAGRKGEEKIFLGSRADLVLYRGDKVEKVIIQGRIY